jgi:Mrp family chromosome partitioning ATPase
MVTSALPDEGKSTIAWHLAMTEASMGANVLLVEADLRRPVLGRRYGTEAHKTVADVALGGVSLAEAVVRHPVPNSPFQTLSLLLANPTATPVVAPEHLIHLVREASKDFDIVVVDAASPLAVAETVALLSAVDGVIVVSRISRSTEAASRRLSQLLQDLKTPVLGVVINAEEPAWSYPALVEPAVRLERS